MALKKKHSRNPEVVSVTASTGMAASNIGGNLSIASPVGFDGPRSPLSDIKPRDRHDVTLVGRDRALCRQH
jgi:hypothetical protein